MRVLPARTGLFLIGLIGLLLRFCPRNGGADAIGKGGARRKAGIRRKLGDIRLQKHDLLRPVRDFAQAKRQGQVDGITQGLNIFPQGRAVPLPTGYTAPLRPWQAMRYSASAASAE